VADGRSAPRYSKADVDAAVEKALLAESLTGDHARRYRFLLAMLIDRQVLAPLGDGWVLRGIWGVDDSTEYRAFSLQGGPEGAIDAAIAQGLNK
jgi:hypothetical protein